MLNQMLLIRIIGVINRPCVFMLGSRVEKVIQSPESRKEAMR